MLGDIALLCDSCLRANVPIDPHSRGVVYPRRTSSSDASQNELNAHGSYGSPARDFTDVWPG